MADRDVNVLLKKQQDDTTNSMYPVTKIGNVLVDSRNTLDSWITSQQKANLSYDTGLKKLSTIEENAEANQNAFSLVRVGSDILTSVVQKDTLTFEGDENIIISIENGKIHIALGDQSIEDVTERQSGLMSPAFVKKLNGIEENANKYVHPTSKVLPGDYIRLTVDEYGHITAANNNPMSISEGGTGGKTLEEIKRNLEIPDAISISEDVIQNDSHAVSGNAVYKALLEKAPINHGNHVPDSTNDTTKFLQDGNVWAKLPTANTSNEGIVKLSSTYSEDDDSTAATPKSVYNAYYNATKYADDAITALIDGADENLDTLKEIGSWISEHGDLYEAMITTVGNKVDKEEGKGLSEVNFTSELNTTVTNNAAWIEDHQNVETNAEANIIESIYVNDKQVTTFNKEAHITVPTKVSDIENDTGFITEHPSVTLTSDTTDTSTKNAGNTFDVIDSVSRDTFGHVTAVNTKTITLPSTAEITNGITFISSYTNGTTSSASRAKGSYIGRAKLTQEIEGTGNIDIKLSYELDSSDNLTNIKYTISDTTKNASSIDDGYMSSTDFTKLSKIDENANNYTLPIASTTLGGVKTTSTVTSTSGYTASPIINGVPYYKDTLYTAGDGLTVDSLTPTVFKHASSKLSAKSYGDTSGTRTLGFGDSFIVKGITTDSFGHLTALNEVTLTLPNNPNTDKNVYNAVNTKTKAYITATTNASSSTGTQVFDTGVYLGTEPGELVATTFDGNLSGTADKATNDGSGNKIEDTYEKVANRRYVTSSTQPDTPSSGSILWAEIIAE